MTGARTLGFDRAGGPSNGLPASAGRQRGRAPARFAHGARVTDPKVCHTYGPSRVALETGCDEKTIRRARDEASTLGLACTFNLLDIDPHALDALAAAKGVMLVPLMSDAPDIVASAGAALHVVGKNRDPKSPGGTSETDAELIQTEAENDALLASCLERRSRICAAKLRRAA